jgi:hypothetical protein
MKLLRRITFITAWFFVSVLWIGGAVAALTVFFRKEIVQVTPSSTTYLGTPQKKTQNTPPQGVTAVIEAEDARVLIVTSFLQRHNAALEPHDYFGQKLVEIADAYGIDFRLLPAIAMQESNLCKKIPPNSFNCLGLGVHSRGTWGFDSFDENFEAAAKVLSERYLDEGLTTPQEIMKKYTPSSNGSWASSVNQWISEMEYNDAKLGKEFKVDADLLMYLQTTEQK